MTEENVKKETRKTVLERADYLLEHAFYGNTIDAGHVLIAQEIRELADALRAAAPQPEPSREHCRHEMTSATCTYCTETLPVPSPTVEAICDDALDAERRLSNAMTPVYAETDGGAYNKTDREKAHADLLTPDEIEHFATIRVEHPESGEPVFDNIGLDWLDMNFDRVVNTLRAAVDRAAEEKR